jgi:3-hydroxy-3-methylglutaryl CoA synthase
LFNDAVRAASQGAALPAHLAALAPFAALPQASTLGNRDLDKVLSGMGGAEYAKMVGPGELVSKCIGNSYAAAVHMNIACMVSTLGEGLVGKRLGAFSYGSGAIATMMTFEGAAGGSGGFSLGAMAKGLRVDDRLRGRRECEVKEYLEAMALREAAYGKHVSPVGTVDNVEKGAYYVKEVKPNGVRLYARK